MSTKVIFRRAEVFVLGEVFFRDVRMQSCFALRFLVKRENDGARGRLMNIYFVSNIGPRLACMRTSRKTSARLKITFVDMTYPKGWTGSLLLCPLIFSWTTATATKTPQNSGLDEQKQTLCPPCTCVLHFATFPRRPCPDNNVRTYVLSYR